MRVIKRKKDRKYYYYLRHSLRKDGRVMTRDMYLGREIPKDVEDIKRAFLEECLNLSLSGPFKKIKEGFQEEWKRYPESIKEKVKQQIAEAFTYNTNAIEGSTITLEETRELIERKIAPNKPLRDVKETEAHADLFLEMLNKKEKLSTQLILEWHERLFKETKKDIAGKFREHLIRVGPYVAPDWQDVKRLMDELIKFHDGNKQMNPVELAARLHYRFEKIHPFGDGNGRVGRLMMNYALWHSNYPMLIIEYKKRKSYYGALQKCENGFFSYFAGRYLKAHKKYVKL